MKVFDLLKNMPSLIGDKTRGARYKFFWFYNYAFLRKPKIRSSIPDNPIMQKEIIEELRESNVDICDFEIDVPDYRQYVKNAGYHKYHNYGYGKQPEFPEKSLEHYLAAKLLDLSGDDIYVDIANAGSPAPDIYHELYGCTVYSQDLVFPEGVNGGLIGGDAANMPVEDDFCTKMALHCSFEHFEQDSDIRFIREAGRILKREGKLCILPLYLFQTYAIQTDPSVYHKGDVTFESDAVLYCIKGWKNRHGRFYDVPHFIDRIINNLNRLELTLYVIRNEKDVDPSCYVKFVAVFRKI